MSYSTFLKQQAQEAQATAAEDYRQKAFNHMLELVQVFVKRASPSQMSVSNKVAFVRYNLQPLFEAQGYSVTFIGTNPVVDILIQWGEGLTPGGMWPVAAFTTTVDYDDGEWEIKVKDSSTELAKINRWRWTVTKDGNEVESSRDRNDTFYFNDPGSYEITLAVSYTNEYGSSETSYATSTLVLSAAPSASFNTVPGWDENLTPESYPVSVSFEDTSSGNPHSWLWEVREVEGEGLGALVLTSTLQNPTFAFLDKQYAVTLRATNDDGTGEPYTYYVDARYTAVHAVASYSPIAEALRAVTVIGASSYTTGWAGISSYEWAIYRDGTLYSYEHGAEVALYDLDPGNYEAVLTVNSENSKTAQATTTFVLEAEDLVPHFNLAGDYLTPTYPKTLVATSDSTGEGLSYVWRLTKDGELGASGSSSTFQTPELMDGGTYTISLEVTDRYGTIADFSETFTLPPPPTEVPVANFTLSIAPGSEGTFPKMLLCTDASTNYPSSFTWFLYSEHGTYLSASSSSPGEFVINEPGTYNVQEYAGNMLGISLSVEKPVVILADGIVE